MGSQREQSSEDVLEKYLAEINHHGLLKREEEQDLARRFRKGDLQAGHTLVTSNLRFVVKIAFEYKSYGLKMSDLIQEGNIGLMKAVQKFDPEKGIHLISYAVWWIRAYIQNHVLNSWSLVKLGTTQAQRKLFFSLARTRRELERLGADGNSVVVNADDIARRLRVKPSEVREMEQRMGGHDLSLDAPVGDEANETHVDLLPSAMVGQEDEVADRQETQRVNTQVRAALETLDVRERFIIEHRFLNERGMTLKELGEHFGFSRERARQLELRARQKLKSLLEALHLEVGGEMNFAAQ
jgi:RNA polymerase sigma-32 factor